MLLAVPAAYSSDKVSTNDSDIRVQFDIDAIHISSGKKQNNVTGLPADRHV